MEFEECVKTVFAQRVACNTTTYREHTLKLYTASPFYNLLYCCPKSLLFMPRKKVPRRMDRYRGDSSEVWSRANSSKVSVVSSLVVVGLQCQCHGTQGCHYEEVSTCTRAHMHFTLHTHTQLHMYTHTPTHTSLHMHPHVHMHAGIHKHYMYRHTSMYKHTTLHYIHTSD